MTAALGPVRCPMCGARTVLTRKRGTHAECPDLVQLPPGWWIGYLGELDARGGQIVQILAVCSERCADRLVKQSEG